MSAFLGRDFRFPDTKCDNLPCRFLHFHLQRQKRRSFAPHALKRPVSLVLACLLAGAVRADFETANWTSGSGDSASGTVDGISVTVGGGPDSSSWRDNFDFNDTLNQGNTEPATGNCVPQTSPYEFCVGPYALDGDFASSVGTRFLWSNGESSGAPDTSTLTFAFPEPVTNAVIMFERLGSGGNPTSAVFELNDTSTSMPVAASNIRNVGGTDIVKVQVSEVNPGGGKDAVFRASTPSSEAAAYGGVMVEGTFTNLVFTVYGSDGDGSTSTAPGSDDLEFTVFVNRSPVAVNDTDTTQQGVTLTVNAASGLLADDFDPSVNNPTNGGMDELEVFEFVVGGVTYAAGSTVNMTEGDLTLNADGSYVFVPNPSFSGVVQTVTYKITDGNVGITGTSISQDDATLIITVTPSPADLSIVKTATPGPVAAGSNLTYTLTVTNSGPADAAGVVVNDTLPSGVTWVSTTPSQGSCSAPSGVTCELGTIANGGTASVTIVVTAN